jgi:hypothetical protein
VFYQQSARIAILRFVSIASSHQTQTLTKDMGFQNSPDVP